MRPALSQVKDILKEVLEIEKNVNRRHGLQSIARNEEMVRDMWKKKTAKDRKNPQNEGDPRDGMRSEVYRGPYYRRFPSTNRGLHSLVVPRIVKFYYGIAGPGHLMHLEHACFGDHTDHQV